jgi:hypothetical protein
LVGMGFEFKIQNSGLLIGGLNLYGAAEPLRPNSDLD